MIRICAILAGAIAARVSAEYLDAYVNFASGDTVRTLMLCAALVLFSSALPGARSKARRGLASFDERFPPCDARRVTLSLRAQPAAPQRR